LPTAFLSETLVFGPAGQELETDFCALVHVMVAFACACAPPIASASDIPIIAIIKHHFLSRQKEAHGCFAFCDALQGNSGENTSRDSMELTPVDAAAV